jgi:hypothetical protein
VGIAVEMSGLNGSRLLTAVAKPIIRDRSLYPSVCQILQVVAKPNLERHLREQMYARLLIELEKADEKKVKKKELVNQVEKGMKRENKVAIAFGNQSHAIIDDALKTAQRAKEKPPKPEAPPPPKAVLPEGEQVDPRERLVSSLVSWLTGFGFTSAGSELPIWSDVHEFRGKLDVWGHHSRPDGSSRVVVVDWKTTNYVHPECALQVSAYAKALEETINTKVDEAWVVQIGKDFSVQRLFTVKDLDQSFEAFLHALGMWRFFKKEGSNFSVQLLQPQRPKKIDHSRKNQ